MRNPRVTDAPKIAGVSSESDIDEMLQDVAKRILRAEMAKRGLTYRDLASLLSEIGMRENEPNLKKKITRGTFSLLTFWDA